MAGGGRSRRSQPRPGVPRVWRLSGKRSRQSGRGGQGCRSAMAGGQSRGCSAESGRLGRGCRNSGWRVCRRSVSAEDTGEAAVAD